MFRNCSQNPFRDVFADPFMRSSGQACAEPSGRPLEALDDWTLKLVQGGPPVSNLGWSGCGFYIIGYENQSTTIHWLQYRDFEGINGKVSCLYMADPEGLVNCWSLPLTMRIIDKNNFIGARSNKGVYEIIQRNGGNWTTI